MKKFIIFPTQLFEKNDYLKHMDEIYIIEDPFYFTSKKFHKQKLVLHRASMKYYFDKLLKVKSGIKSSNIHYIEFNDVNYKKILQTQNTQKNNIYMFDPIDKPIINKISKKLNLNTNLIIYDTPSFLETRDELEEYSNNNTNKKNYYHDNFYKWQRKKLNLLMNDNKPINDKWSFDKENRNPYDKDYCEDKILTYNNKYIEEAIQYINIHFSNNFGLIDNIYYPITHKETKKHLKNFIKKKINTFGKYQDGISKKIIFGSHSVLSPMLNIGLITPKEIISEIIKYYNTNTNELVTVEAFIRQLIGWRSYTRFIYHYHGDDMFSMNKLNHNNKISNLWYKENKDFDIINDMINKVNKYAYLHHIERLMIMGNFGLINQINPLDLYDWFMICFIDSYEWVMVPNVFGMSQYSLTNITMMTRPYLSSSNYIKKMSDYKKSNWFELWDSLYWFFIYTHKNILYKIYSISMQVNILNKMTKVKMNNFFNKAKELLYK
jgi:deoxyribodipyrimidine photolyase-related protein